MRYFDTSFLVPLILPEATGDPIAGLLEGLTTEALAVSHWTRIEFSSLLAREVRMGGLSASAAREANSRFESMVAGFFAALLPDRNDFDRAKEYIGHFETGLRAGDALHLAIAGNRGADVIYSLDKLLIEAGKRIGLPTTVGISVPGYGD